MKQDTLKQKLSEGFKLELWLKPTKKFDKLTFKTWLINRETNELHELNYHHTKKFLTEEQKRLKDLYDEVKNMCFADLVAYNVQFKQDPENRRAAEVMTIHQSIKRIESVELI